MNINATFFIQLFHFLIGYLIIERLLLRPWFGVIDNEARQKHEQENILKIAQQRVAYKEQFKEEQWREFQVIFSQSMPTIAIESEIIPTKISPILQHIDKSNLSSLQKEVEQSLVARLIHE